MESPLRVAGGCGGCPVLMLLWVNVHGGFVLGFVLLGLYLLSNAIRYLRSRRKGQEQQEDICMKLARMRELALVTAASLAASLINPYGYKLHVHVYRYLSSRWLMNHIDEFLSPNFHGVAQQCFVAILLITIVALAFAGKKLTLPQLLVLLFAAYSGLYASRSLPVSSLLLTLIVAPLLTQAVRSAASNSDLSLWLRVMVFAVGGVRETHGKRRSAFQGARMAAAGGDCRPCCCVHSRAEREHCNGWTRISTPPVFRCRPVDAIVQRNIREPIFAPDSWGGYLIYRLYPQNKVLSTTGTISTEKSS